MFTGIIERTGRLRSRRRCTGGVRIEVAPEGPVAAGSWDDLTVGESIAVNGVCLTLVAAGATALGFDVVEETLRRTCLGENPTGTLLNLERSLRLGDRLGGHLVSGHVDGVGRVVSLRRGERETLLRIEGLDPGFRVIPKGSVAIDGISLTVAECDGDGFTVAVIPHTLQVTNLKERRVGERVHLEMDMIGKWVAELLRPVSRAAAPSTASPEAGR